MVAESSPRKYELRRRADTMIDTRRRIIAAAVELHANVGPSRTTIAAIAGTAGVQRHTVYRHFPTDEDLFTACSAHFWALHPWPDPDQWEGGGIEDRLTVALSALYRSFADIELMMTHSLRDVDLLPVVRQSLAPYFNYVETIAHRFAEELAPGHVPTAVALRHAVDFPTWQSLVAQGGLNLETAVELMVSMSRSASVLPTSEVTMG